MGMLKHCSKEPSCPYSDKLNMFRDFFLIGFLPRLMLSISLPTIFFIGYTLVAWNSYEEKWKGPSLENEQSSDICNRIRNGSWCKEDKLRHGYEPSTFPNQFRFQADTNAKQNTCLRSQTDMLREFHCFNAKPDDEFLTYVWKEYLSKGIGDVAFLATIIFAILTAINLYLKEVSVGWKRLYLVISALASGTAAYIEYNDSFFRKDALIDALMGAFMVFPASLLLLLLTKLVFEWIKDGFRVNRQLVIEPKSIITTTNDLCDNSVSSDTEPPIANIEPPLTDKIKTNYQVNYPKIVAQEQISGIGGWLRFLIIILMVIGPMVGFGNLSKEFHDALEQYPQLANNSQWQSYRQISWLIFSISAAISFSAGYRLWKIHFPESVRFAVFAIWLAGPLGNAMYIIAALVIFGTHFFENEVAQMIGGFLGTSVAAGIWTAYLMRSVRVKNTYNN